MTFEKLIYNKGKMTFLFVREDMVYLLNGANISYIFVMKQDLNWEHNTKFQVGYECTVSSLYSLEGKEI